jgi:hypothetical protein
MWDFNSADTCLIACISAERISRSCSSEALGYGFGATDVLAPQEPCVFGWPVTGGIYPIGWPANGTGWCKFSWPELANWFRSISITCMGSTCYCGAGGCPIIPRLTGCWGDGLVWATVLAGVKIGCVDSDCCTGAVYTGIPSISWGADF